MQILTNLIKAVSNVAKHGTPQPESTQYSGGDSTASVEDAIKRLFPSTEGQSQRNIQQGQLGELNAPDYSITSTDERNAPDRHHVADITRFNPRNTYRPKSGKKAKSSSSQAPKRQHSKSSDSSHSSE